MPIARAHPDRLSQCACAGFDPSDVHSPHSMLLGSLLSLWGFGLVKHCFTQDPYKKRVASSLHSACLHRRKQSLNTTPCSSQMNKLEDVHRGVSSEAAVVPSECIGLMPAHVVPTVASRAKDDPLVHKRAHQILHPTSGSGLKAGLVPDQDCQTHASDQDLLSTPLASSSSCSACSERDSERSLARVESEDQSMPSYHQGFCAGP